VSPIRQRYGSEPEGRRRRIVLPCVETHGRCPLPSSSGPALLSGHPGRHILWIIAKITGTCVAFRHPFLLAALALEGWPPGNRSKLCARIDRNQLVALRTPITLATDDQRPVARSARRRAGDEGSCASRAAYHAAAVRDSGASRRRRREVALTLGRPKDDGLLHGGHDPGARRSNARGCPSWRLAGRFMLRDAGICRTLGRQWRATCQSGRSWQVCVGCEVRRSRRYTRPGFVQRKIPGSAALRRRAARRAKGAPANDGGSRAASLRLSQGVDRSRSRAGCRRARSLRYARGFAEGAGGPAGGSWISRFAGEGDPGRAKHEARPRGARSFRPGGHHKRRGRALRSDGFVV